MQRGASRWRSWSYIVVGAVVGGGTLGSNTWHSWGEVGYAATPPRTLAKEGTKEATTEAPVQRFVVPPQSDFSAPFNDPDSCTIDKSGVPLCWKADTKLFPDYWLTKQINATATDLAPGERKRVLRMMTRAMRRYSSPLLRKHLTAVYLVGSLHFSGISVGGTNSLNRVYIHDEGTKKGYTDAFLERTFHHEFSSVLLRLHTDIWDDAAWRACNAPGFTYGTNGSDAVREKKASTVPDVKLMEKGCLNQYATASTEEDFNEMVEVVFCGTPKQRDYLTRFPALERKAQLVRAFYNKLGVNFS